MLHHGVSGLEVETETGTRRSAHAVVKHRSWHWGVLLREPIGTDALALREKAALTSDITKALCDCVTAALTVQSRRPSPPVRVGLLLI